jgi:hypothetical protein
MNRTIGRRAAWDRVFVPPHHHNSSPHSPNKAIVSEAVYQAKADRWARLWPKLTVLPC